MKTGSKRILIIVVGILIILAAAAFFGIRYYRQEKASGLAEDGKAALEEYKSDEALDLYNQALSYDSGSIPAQEGLAQVYDFKGNVEEASKTYMNLFDQTKDNKYKRLAQLCHFGNTLGNSANYGTVVSKAGVNCFVMSDYYGSNIYKENDGKYKSLLNQAATSTISNINFWEGSLFYTAGQELYQHDIQNGLLMKVYTPSDAHITNLQIYDGNFYYTSNGYGGDSGFFKMPISLNETIQSERLYPQDDSQVYPSDFCFSEDGKYAFINDTTVNAESSRIIKVDLTTLESTTMYEYNEGIIQHLQCYEGNVYFNQMLGLTDMESFTVNYDDSIYKLDVESGNVDKIPTGNPVSTLNLGYNGEIYFGSIEKLFLMRPDSQETVEIGSAEASENQFGTMSLIGLADNIGYFDINLNGSMTFPGNFNTQYSFNFQEPYNLTKVDITAQPEQETISPAELESTTKPKPTGTIPGLIPGTVEVWSENAPMYGAIFEFNKDGTFRMGYFSVFTNEEEFKNSKVSLAEGKYEIDGDHFKLYQKDTLEDGAEVYDLIQEGDIVKSDGEYKSKDVTNYVRETNGTVTPEKFNYTYTYKPASESFDDVINSHPAS